MDDGPGLVAGGLGRPAVAALIERVPVGFEVSAGVIDFAKAPWSEVTYAYRRGRPPASRWRGCPSRCAKSSRGGFARFMLAGSG